MNHLAFAFLVSSVFAWAKPPAEFRMPSYKLVPGQRLYYSRTSESKTARGESRSQGIIEVLVVSTNPDSSRHLIFRQSRARAADSTDEEREPRVDWSYCDLSLDGHYADNASLQNFDPSTLFFLLPKDTVTAKQGWAVPDTANEGVQHYQLDNKTVAESIWVIALRDESPYDSAYLLGHSALIYFDTRRALTVRRESRSSQRVGGSSGVSSAITVLDSVTRSDTAKERPLIADIEQGFTANRLYNELAGRAEGDSADRLMAQAETVLVRARDAVKDSTMKAYIENALKQHDRYEKYRRSDRAKGPKLEGKPAPNWTLEDFEGKKVSLKSLRGKVVLLDFWYFECPWCVRAMPKLEALYQRYKDRGVVVFGMNKDSDPEPGKAMLGRMKITYPSLKARGVEKQYEVTGFPTVFVIDQQGIVRKVDFGYSKDMGQKLAAEVDELLGKK